jgi:hypothetical protein
MEDWVGMQRDGCTWALASPLACEDEACERLLGAVLVGGGGGVGGENRIDKEWLHEWCCELAHAITHASISVMESSLVCFFINFSWFSFFNKKMGARIKRV